VSDVVGVCQISIARDDVLVGFVGVLPVTLSGQDVTFAVALHDEAVVKEALQPASPSAVAAKRPSLILQDFRPGGEIITEYPLRPLLLC